MKLKTHIGYDVYNLDQTINFYVETMGASLAFKNDLKKTASLIIGGCEVNIFQVKEFGGYHSSLIKSMHIGFQCLDKNDVDEIYKRALKNKTTVFSKPYERFDGDYTFFIQDPDGMQLEVYYGDHDFEKGAPS